MGKFITQYKKYIAGAVLAVLLVLSFNFYVSRKEEIAYNNGFDTANAAWIKKGKEYVDIINKGLAYNRSLNVELDKQILANQQALDKQTNKVSDMQVEYVQTPASKNYGLDDQFVDIYNESLGVK